jgi:hypothetical protein
MGPQTRAAREIVRRDERRSRTLLESVEQSGRQALEELRRCLDLLSDQDGDAPLSDQPGATEIPQLIEQVRAAGAAVCGGTLDAHPGLEVGYAVRARIPLDSVGARADEC